ncbi:MAG: MFS transporter [Coriobacteriales bacterium]|nr:MFS transporter [Coriobacteriales bacterium]
MSKITIESNNDISTADHTVNEQTPAKAWLILAVVYFASIMAPLSQFKIPPLATWLFAAYGSYGLDNVSFGLLMSSMAIVGCLLAFPAAFITRRIGLKATVLLSLACLAIGNALGAAITELGALMIGRLIEGIGIGLIGVAAPACVSVWFPEKSRGKALGIWATWVPVGIIVMFNLAPAFAGVAGDPATLTADHVQLATYASNATILSELSQEDITLSREVGIDGYCAIYWGCAFFSTLAFLLFALVFKMPHSSGTGAEKVKNTTALSAKDEDLNSRRDALDASGEATNTKVVEFYTKDRVQDAKQLDEQKHASNIMEFKGSLLTSFCLLRNRNIWLLGIVFFVFCWCTLGVVNTFHGNFVMGPPLNLTQQEASSLTSIIMFIAIFSSAAAGVAFDKVSAPKKKYLIVVTLSVLLVSNLFGFNATPALAFPFLIVMVVCQGISGGATGGVCRPFAPLLMGGTPMGAIIAMALLQFMQNFGNALASPLFGALLGITGGDYYFCSIVFQAPALLIGIVAALLINVRQEVLAKSGSV